MLSFAVSYFVLILGLLAFLATMILKIGRLLGNCPESGTAARAAAVTIATGFCVIGAGGVILIGAAVPLAHQVLLIGFMLLVGFAALCLGLGFTHAVGTLQGVVHAAKSRATQSSV